MLSNVWAGDPAVTQPFGCTDLIVEPWWNIADCHWHCGVDIGLNIGTPLYAARAGRVSALSYGILGIQVTGRTETDYYVHIDSSAVPFGAMVAQGALVAYSGAKVPAGGYLTGPHLHFEVNTGALNTPASSIDPIPVLQQTFSGGSGSLGGPEVLDATDPIVQEIINALYKNNQAMLPDLHDFWNAGAAGMTWQVFFTKLLAAQAGGATDLTPVLNAIAAQKVELDALAAAVDALGKHLGEGTA
jgi:murein DD-endopeptidase MepM/ murein hydrolase activator NlpD